MFVKLKKEKKKKKDIRACILVLLVPIVLELMYALFCIGLQKIPNVSTMVSMLIGDALFSVLFGLLYWCCFVWKKVKSSKLELQQNACSRILAQKSNYKLKSSAWFVIFLLFLVSYVFGQAVTAYVGIKLPSDYVNTYRDLKSYELYLYLFVAVTFGPIVEEFLFRGFFYKYLRGQYSVFVCAIVSSVVFGLSHGTTEHMPMTCAFGLFLCFILELTGKIRYCIGFHMLANLLGMVYIVSIPISYAFCIVVYFIYIAVMLVMLAGVDVLRQKWKFCASDKTFTEKLEEKRKHWGENSES